MALWVVYAGIQFPAYRAAKRLLGSGNGNNNNGGSNGNSASDSSGSSAPSASGGGVQRAPRSLAAAGNSSSSSMWPAIAAGGLAGGFATVVTYPLDWIRTRFASQGVPRVRSVGFCIARPCIEGPYLQACLLGLRLPAG
jgi:hypothetical protein